VSPSTGKKYGLARVCRLWGLPRSTVNFRRHRECIPTQQRPDAKKRGPHGRCSDEELVGHIRRILAESPFHGEGYRKVWARLRYQGIRTSKERVRRLMREHGLQAPHRVGHPHRPKAHDGTITTERPDVLWGTDMTTTVTTGEGQVCVFVVVHHCTAECIGVHAAKSGNRFEALEPIRQGVREYLGAFDKGVAAGLAMRHDHGSAYMSDDFQQELTFPGDGQLAELRAGARGEWLRRAVDPNAQGEPALGPHLRHRRGAGGGSAGVPAAVQRAVADRTTRLPDPLASPLGLLCDRGTLGNRAAGP
jgi:hypothetical protein